MSKSKSVGILGLLLLVVCISFLSNDCTKRVPMSPMVQHLGINEKIPIEAAIFITEEKVNYVYRGNPESFTGSAVMHEFPLGEALQSASVDTFSQLFEKVIVKRTLKEAQGYKVIIEPEIQEFHFRYNQLSYAGFAIAVHSKIKVRAAIFNGETKLWEKTIESPEEKRGPG